MQDSQRYAYSPDEGSRLHPVPQRVWVDLGESQ